MSLYKISLLLIFGAVPIPILPFSMIEKLGVVDVLLSIFNIPV
jgi:hypothetical protein